MTIHKILYLLLITGGITCRAHAQMHKENIRIAWDYSSLHQIAERGGYPRLLRLKDSSILVIYETYTGDIHLKRSLDNGKSWQGSQGVFTQFNYKSEDGDSTLIRMSNPEVVQLANGDIILACNYRPAKNEIAPFSIAIRRSKDNGQNWLPPQILYNAAPRFIDGCWEPSFLQLPNGELQIYFANENPYQHSDEQEISMLSSSDNGVTWTSAPTTVSFRKGRRDGMPVPILTDKDIVVAIEDNNIETFKPYTVRTTIPEGWKQPVLGTSSQRHYALERKIPDTVYMGAPYLLRLPDGQTVLSYQTTEGRTSAWERSTMEVTIGNREARHFQSPTRPFPVPPDKEAKWNSVAMWDANTVAALTSTNFRSPFISPWLIRGYLIPGEIKATANVDNLPIFVGHRSKRNLRAGVSNKKNMAVIHCRFSPDRLAEDTGAVNIYFSLGKQAYKATLSGLGKTILYEEKDGAWQRAKDFTQAVLTHQNGQQQWQVNIPVKPDLQYICIAFGLIYTDKGISKEEQLTGMYEFDLSTWIRVRL